MTGVEVVNYIPFSLPPEMLGCGALCLILSLIEISPLKLNPWKYIKSFFDLPHALAQVRKEVEVIQRDINNDRAYKWRAMILSRADHVRRGHKMSQERWNDTIDTMDNYEGYCELMEKNGDTHFVNGKAKTAIKYLRKKHEYVYENNDYLVDELDYEEEDV